MNRTLMGAAVSGVALAVAGTAQAQDAGFSWEGSLEVGIDSTISASDPAAEFTDTYLSLEMAFEAAVAERVAVFGTLTLESVLDASDDRAFEDLGLYANELGLRFGAGPAEISIGKISPVFAVAWDAAPGFYGTSLAEDYELAEQIGVTVDAPLGNAGGVLSFGVFYADDTALSNSVGTKRGRNSVADGGAGNTGELDNVAVQYSQPFGDATTAWIGGRRLSAGQGDPQDETAVVAGVTHDFGNGFDMIAEVAHFDGIGGSNDDATYTTLGGSYAMQDWTFSLSATGVDTSSAGSDHMIALGVDRAISESFEVNFGLARFDVGGETSTAVALAAVVTF